MDIFSAASILRIAFLALFVIGVAALVISLIFLFSKRNKAKKTYDYFKKQLHHTMRNNILERALNDYQKQGEKNYWLVKIVEQNQFGESEHFFNLNEGDVTIGKDFRKNKLCIYDDEAASVQCKVVLNKEIPSLMNISEKKETVFKPKKKYDRNITKNHVMRNGETIKLHTFDVVSFGETSLLFYVFNNNQGIV